MDFKKLGNSLVPVQLDEVQADADVWCYDCVNMDKALYQAQLELDKYIKHVKNGVNTKQLYLHVTTGLKGGRVEMATVKPYQENRPIDVNLSARVKALRMYMVKKYTQGDIIAVNWKEVEADDGMATYQTTAHTENRTSAILSIDKDLNMIEGLHIDPKSFERTKFERIGRTYWTKTEAGNDKFKGEGLLWFWHQMLFGDRVDNIVGLPYLTGELANRYIPVKNPKGRKPLSCGEKRGIAVLEGVTCDREAFNRVYEAYSAHYGVYAAPMMFEQAFLLWIRRTDNTLDVLEYFKELGFNYELNNQQQQALGEYNDRREQQRNR